MKAFAFVWSCARPVRFREKYEAHTYKLPVRCPRLSSVLTFVLATRSLTLIEFELSKTHKCLQYRSRT